MSMIPRCCVCDDALDAHGQGARCARCNQPCPTCNGDTAFCRHALAKLADEPLAELKRTGTGGWL